MKISVDVEVFGTSSSRSDLDRLLEEAVETLRARTLSDGRQGILVTRHSYGSFTVALSDAVPFGLTREHTEW